MKKYAPVILFSVLFVCLLVFLSFRNSLNLVKKPVPFQITPTSVPTSTSLQTYRNEKYGFEFQYPGDLSKSSYSNEGAILSLITSGMPGNALEITTDMKNISNKNIFEYYKNLANKCKRGSINEYINTDFCDLSPNVYNKSGQLLPYTTSQTINNIDFIIKKNIVSDGSCGPYISASWMSNKTVFTMYFSDCFYSMDENKASIFDQILSTFKFLPDTSTWKTYKNSQYGFEFQYPNNLTVKLLGPNVAQQQLNNGKQISETVQPSLETVSFFDSTGKTIFDIIIFNPTEKLLSSTGYNDDYLYLFGDCDLRWLDQKPNSIESVVVNGQNFLTVKAIRDSQSIICSYTKNINKNLLVFETSDDELLNQILSTFKFTQ